MAARRRRVGLIFAAAGAGLVVLMPVGIGADASTASDARPAAVAEALLPDRGVYRVTGAGSAAERTAVTASGVDVLGVSDGALTVVATPAQATGLRESGYDLMALGDFDRLLDQRSNRAGERKNIAPTDDFPSGDERYHTYAELTATLEKTARNHSDVTTLSTIGQSHEGRALHLMKLSDNAGIDENEPEVLFTCNAHAREHLTTEMCLHIVDRFTRGYGSDPVVTTLMDSREIFVIPSVNPDGAEFDITDGRYHGWRKTRSSNTDSRATGTDPNRNWDYRWGCCGGSSPQPASETYRGRVPFSEAETRAVADFVDSRSRGGAQQIKAHIDFHTFSELVLWPFGWTENDLVDGMTAEEHARFVRVGTRMARANGYTAEQASDLYVTDGTMDDWMWGRHKVLSYTFEMFPADGGLKAFYPPDEVIDAETSRNDAAVDILLREAGRQPPVAS